MTQKNTWSRIPNELFAREDITPLVKIVYVYMLQRYQFFVVEQKKDYYETQEQIAQNCGISLTAAKQAMKRLYQLDWLSVRKIKQQGHIFNNLYSVKDVFGSYTKPVKVGLPRSLTKKLFNPTEDDDIF